MRLSPAFALLPLLLAAAPLLRSGVPPASRQSEETDEPATLTATGVGEVAVRPDRAVVRLGATAQATTAVAAQGQVDEVMQRALAAIRQAGIPEEHVQTTGLALYPVYSQPAHDAANEEGFTPTIVAYRAGNTVRVQVDHLPLVGTVIDAGIGAGANQLEGLSFELRDDTAVRAEALRLATRNARQKATALAEAAEVRLLAVQRIAEGDGAVPLQRDMRASFEMAAVAVEPGQVRVQASVTLTYRIGPQTTDR